jgi:FKBP-type peptidyl-prolyl cis-trans isomerase
MKTKISMFIPVILALVMASCGQDYKKTKSGLVYKIVSGGSKDTAANGKDWFKFHFVQKIHDSVLYSSFDKMPRYFQFVSNDPRLVYNPLEVVLTMKKGDSSVVIQIFDSLIRTGQSRQYPMGKKGDRISTYIKVVDIFRNDSLYEKDVAAEELKDAPRREKEEKEMMAKQEEENKKKMEEYFKQEAIEIEAMKKSGAIAAQLKEVEDYLGKKKITTAVKSGDTYVVVKEKGTGAPTVNGKFITVKYAGRVLATDSVFQSNHYTFPLGQREVIQGWDQGLLLFNKGGKGTLYIPGYLSYGNNPGPAGKPQAALIFEVEVLDIADTREQGESNQRRYDSIAAVRNTAQRPN